ncbi:CHAT domain-containing protein [Arthrobacter sp. SLBN-100]|uniref:CHAT domain-containing protein n=1 Tax=Arthrobacter sp. SLBN-100 TaxID=2768450 RepID=UPI00114F41A4|nr:CHAT domain-containing protein [Arthrobacter sp. SLBN-100]TQJ67759.1 CHAT domain-containing protein [Arthrobacter sp. SLBN-100]
MNPQLTIEQLAWLAAEDLRQDLLNIAASTYLRATIEDAAKEDALLAAAFAELQQKPADAGLLKSFATALAEVLRKDAGLAERLENWARQSMPPRYSGDIEAEAAPAEATPDAAAPLPPSNAAQAWLNAELEDADAAQPLLVGETYTLAISLDQAAKNTVIASGAPVNLLFPPGTEELTITVQLDSDHFEVRERSLPLHFRRSVAGGKAAFHIVPRTAGRHNLVATVHHAGNFLQQLTITIDVGAVADRPLTSSSQGRPMADAASLQPRDIGFAIEPAPGGGYNCTAWGATAARVYLPIEEQELASAIDQVRRALLDVVGKQKFRTQLDIPPEDRDGALRILAKEGFRLYQKIFYHPAGGADARRLGDWLRQQTTGRDEVLKIQLLTRNFPVPWGLLYIDDEWKAGGTDWRRFLGMSHIIEQIPLQTAMTTLSGVIDSGPTGLSVSVNFNESIDEQMHADFVARQVQYWGAAADFRPPINLVSRTKRAELVGALKDAASPDQILYLFCHAVAAGLTGDGPDASCLVLSGDERITLGDLNLEAPTTVQLAGSPLVFINACESAELSPLFYDGFVPYFMAKGARGVIGTECKTPALFAAEWAKSFFDQFLEGGSLGEVFLRMRREFFEQHGNPLGLIYGIHCDGDTRVHPAMSRAGH